LVDFEDAFQLAVENFAVDVGQVKIDHRLAVNAETVLVDDLVNSASGYVTRNQVAVFRVPLFQKIPALALRDRQRVALVAGSLRHPDSPAFAAGRLRHQAKLVFAGNRGGMDLNELAVRIKASLLEKRGLCGSGTDDRVGGFSKNRTDAAGSDDDGVSRKGRDFHAAQVHGADAAADAVAVEHGGEEFPGLVLGDFSFRLVAAHLLVERIQKLLARSGSGKCRAVEQRPAEAAEVKQSFGSAVEGNAHAIEQVDDAGRGVAHALYRRLVGEEVSAVNGVVEVLPGGVALALQVLGGIDTTLRTD